MRSKVTLDTVFKFVRKNRMYLALVGGGVFLLFINILIFYPGYMSFDTMMQLSQALGVTPVSDWHPPVMAMVWKLLITLTGSVSAMLFFQLLLLWGALTVLSVYVFAWTRKKHFSLIVLLSGLLPFVLNLSGVIWKDSQMAFSLLLASVLILVLIQNKLKRSARYGIVGVIGILIAYACLIRHNAFVAALPLLFLSVRYGLDLKHIRKEIVALVAACLGILLLNVALTAIVNPKSTHPTAAVMVDDIVNVLSKKEIDQAPASLPAKELLRGVIDTCKDKDLRLNSIDYCTDGGRDKLSITYYDDVKATWEYALKTYPVNYAGFRFKAFATFFFSPDKSSYYWAKGIHKNGFGLAVRFNDLGEATRVYVKDFGYKHFSFFFQPWFWAAASVGLLWWSRRLVKMRLFIVLTCTSGLVYTASYLPVVIGMDYRYVYWSMFAVLMSLCAVFIEKYEILPLTARLKKLKPSKR